MSYIQSMIRYNKLAKVGEGVFVSGRSMDEPS